MEPFSIEEAKKVSGARIVAVGVGGGGGGVGGDAGPGGFDGAEVDEGDECVVGGVGEECAEEVEEASCHFAGLGCGGGIGAMVVRGDGAQEPVCDGGDLRLGGPAAGVVGGVTG